MLTRMGDLPDGGQHRLPAALLISGNQALSIPRLMIDRRMRFAFLSQEDQVTENFGRRPCKIGPDTPTLQLLPGGTYSAPYVAVDFDSDLTSHPSGRLPAPSTRGAYAAPAQRGLGSGFWIRHDREHIRRSDFFGIDESHSLSWSDLFRGNFAANFFDRETKPGTTGRRSRK